MSSAAASVYDITKSLGAEDAGRIKRLLENPKVKRFLQQRYAELLEEFQELAALETL